LSLCEKLILHLMNSIAAVNKEGGAIQPYILRLANTHLPAIYLNQDEFSC